MANVLSRFINKPANAIDCPLNVFSAIHKPKSYSNLCKQKTLTSFSLLKLHTAVEIMMTEAPPLVIFSNWDSVGEHSAGTLKKADSGSLLLWSRIPRFSCCSSGSNILEITIVWNGLSADAVNGHWWKQSEQHQISYHAYDAQTIEAYPYEIRLPSWRSWW